MNTYYTWQKSILTLPNNLTDVICSTVSVSPWTNGAGQKTENGTFLSPNNAINLLKQKLKLANSTDSVVIFMQSSTKLENMIAQLQLMSNLLPITQIESTLRKATAMLTLFDDRMNIPQLTAKLPPFQKLSAPTLRDIEKNQHIESALKSAQQSINIENISSELDKFKSIKTEIQSNINKSVSKLVASTELTIVNSFSAPVAIALSEIEKNIPDPDHIYTCAQMFISNDLSQINRMINRYEPE